MQESKAAMLPSSRAGANAGLALLTALLLQACAAVGPDYEPPVIATPDAWAEQITEDLARGPDSALQNWWTVFEDPVLDSLIERCRAQNLDLLVATSRVRESRAVLAIAQGAKLPVAEGEASAAATKQSDDGPLQQVAPPGGFESQDLLQLRVDAGWELDVFGRVRRSIEAAGAQYQASVEDYRDVMVTLFAEVALAYTDARSAQQRIRYLQDNVATQRESLALAVDSFESGVSSRLDVAQAETSLAVTQALIPAVQASLNQSLNRLAVLLGQDAGSLRQELQAVGPVPAPGEAIGVGVPADLLRQRPDIRRNERLLAAQTAQIGVATADLYPSFSIGGFIGLQSRSAADLFDGSSVTWGLGTPIQWSLFDGGRIRSNIEVQDEKAQQRLLQYRNSVLGAIEEVENAIVGYNLSQTRKQLLGQAVSSAGEALDLVLVQYRAGLTDFNNVLVTQRELQTQQDHLVVAESDVVLDLIALYKALGGGWSPADADPNPTTP